MSALSIFKYNSLFLTVVCLYLSGCASSEQKPLNVFDASRQVYSATREYTNDQQYIHLLQQSRTWMPEHKLQEDPIEIGMNAKIPVHHEGARILGPSEDDALRSLALKIWMIENAQHTIDVVYYIFSPDLAGKAILGALCNAVKRGIDVRIMVDSIGSISPFHTDLLALTSCADQAGYMRTLDGSKTTYKARVQAVVFNALTRYASSINRRSHDKIMVMDGAFPSKAVVITGGRNISLTYYGIKENGSIDHHVYRDLEVVLKPGAHESFTETTVGDVATTYFTLLFLHNGNLLLQPVYQPVEDDIVAYDPYQHVRESAQESLTQLKNLPDISQRMKDMADYINNGFHNSKVMLAHELGNLTNTGEVEDAIENKEDNKNSIRILFGRFLKTGSLRVVSPYLFVPRYIDEDGKVFHDGIVKAHEWLQENPTNRIEIVTNSVLTSDNFLAQCVIDMDLAPRLLLTPELRKAWLSSLEKGELNPDLVESEEWKRQISNPKIDIYEMGRLDSAALGNGSKHYGKLHAKFLIGDKTSFVGTSNLDYRSRLYNNEMGFIIENSEIQEDLDAVFDQLKASSYRWGTPEWLQMRKEVMQQGGMKGWSTKQQRFIYNFLRRTGLIWYI